MSFALDAMQAEPKPVAGDERALLTRFELLLEREQDAIAARDAGAIAAVADERALLTGQLAGAARDRRAGPALDPADEAALIERYRRLQHLHNVRGQVVRRHADHNSRAVGVLAQAVGAANVYKSDGTVALQFSSN
jgi:flagellar biosynthesis/type III secretory pathway chaperone